MNEFFEILSSIFKGYGDIIFLVSIIFATIAFVWYMVKAGQKPLDFMKVLEKQTEVIHNQNTKIDKLEEKINDFKRIYNLRPTEEHKPTINRKRKLRKKNNVANS